MYKYIIVEIHTNLNEPYGKIFGTLFQPVSTCGFFWTPSRSLGVISYPLFASFCMTHQYFWSAFQSLKELALAQYHINIYYIYIETYCICKYIVPGMPHCVRSSAITSSKWPVAGRRVHVSPTFILGVPSKGWIGGTCKLAFTVQITSFKLYTENGMKWNEINIFTNYAGNRTTKMGGQKSTTVASSTRLLQSKTTTCHHIISDHIISYHISLSHR